MAIIASLVFISIVFVSFVAIASTLTESLPRISAIVKDAHTDAGHRSTRHIIIHPPRHLRSNIVAFPLENSSMRQQTGRKGHLKLVA